MQWTFNIKKNLKKGWVTGTTKSFTIFFCNFLTFSFLIFNFYLIFFIVGSIMLLDLWKYLTIRLCPSIHQRSGVVMHKRVVWTGDYELIYLMQFFLTSLSNKRLYTQMSEMRSHLYLSMRIVVENRVNLTIIHVTTARGGKPIRANGIYFPNEGKISANTWGQNFPPRHS